MRGASRFSCALDRPSARGLRRRRRRRSTTTRPPRRATGDGERRPAGELRAGDRRRSRSLPRTSRHRRIRRAGLAYNARRATRCSPCAAAAAPRRTLRRTSRCGSRAALLFIFFFYSTAGRSPCRRRSSLPRKLYWYAATDIQGPFGPRPRSPGCCGAGASRDRPRPREPNRGRGTKSAARRVPMGQLENLRLVNRARVVDVLRQRAAVSRSDLVRLTGLSRTTVASVVADLQARGLVVERRDRGRRRPQSGRGRPPMLLSLHAAAGAALGISLRPRAAAGRGRRPLLERAGRARSRVSTSTTSRRPRSRSPPSLAGEALAEAGVERDQVVGAAVGLPVAGRPPHAAGLRDADPLAVGRDRRPRRALARARRCRSRSRTTRTSARSARSSPARGSASRTSST